MIPDREPEQTFDSVILVREQPDDELTERQLLDRKVKRIVRTSRATALIALYGLGSITLVINEDVIQEGVAATTSHNKLNDEVSDIASQLAGSPIYVSCNDDFLNKLDVAAPLQENGTPYIREAVAHPVELPYGMGFVAPLTTMREGTCETIVNYDPALPANMSDDESAIAKHEETKSYAGAVYTLLHEIEHTNEIRNEAEASCYAFQKLPAALEQLEVDARYIHLVPGILAYEKARASMSEYLSDECKYEGVYDLGISNVYFTKPAPAIPPAPQEIIILPLVPAKPSS